MRARERDRPVVFLSGYSADIVQGFGIPERIAFISKPVSSVELLRKMREALR